MAKILFSCFCITLHHEKHATTGRKARDKPVNEMASTY
jgi:hypothetical protein